MDNVCQCCSVEGHLKDMAETFQYEGVQEVYADMVKDCFNITIPKRYGETRKICINCVKELREACHFKRKILDTQNKFRNIDYQTVFDKPKENTIESIEPVNIKVEKMEVKDESDDGLSTMCFYERLDEENEEDDVKLSEVSKIIQASKTPDKEKPKKLAEARIMSRKKILTMSQLTTGDQLTNLKDSLIRRGLLRRAPASLHPFEDIMTVLDNSTLIPFKSKRPQGYRCFYCPFTLKDATELRNHTVSDHDNNSRENMRKVLTRSGLESIVVNVDASIISCKLCAQSLNTIPELRKHLSESHNKNVKQDANERIIPFRLTSKNFFECFVCDARYEVFVALERHMNIHYQNAICDVCGSGYVTPRRLKSHVNESHVTGNFACELCPKVFSTNTKLKNHVSFVHKSLRRYVCPHCKETFTDYWKRQSHLVKEHDAAPLEYKCQICSYVFNKKFLLTSHVRKDHLQERNHSCDVCGFSCFSRHELRNHAVRHNAERIYECQVCNKAYARKKTLREHMRIHNNDRRFSCAVCGQSFVQKCSLKGHMKTHHADYADNKMI